jgi:hypothetical protein
LRLLHETGELSFVEHEISLFDLSCQ